MNADKIIMADMCEKLICESIYGGDIVIYSDQNLRREIIAHLEFIQQGNAEPKEFLVATREEMEELWNAEEEAVMQAEFRIL